MRTSRFVILGVLCAGVALLIGADRQPTKAPTRVAYVTLSKVMDGLVETKDIEARMEQMRADAQRQLDEINAKIKKLDTDIDMAKERPKEQHRLSYQKIGLNAAGEAQQKIIAQLLQEEAGTTMRDMYLKITDAAERLRAQDGWDIVLRDDREMVPAEKTSQGRPLTGREVKAVVDQRAILAAGPGSDITAQLVTLLNNEYKAGKK